MSLESIVNQPLANLLRFEQLQAHSANAQAYVEAFSQQWRDLGRALLEQQLQQQIEAVEQ
ncbi:MAG: hypothetical protein F6J97_26145, partial [Leptolyngbya sp. SIO4C1]|nr:hypothetical protein [Leptolyngbya sp. SIO4C1]